MRIFAMWKIKAQRAVRNGRGAERSPKATILFNFNCFQSHATHFFWKPLVEPVHNPSIHFAYLDTRWTDGAWTPQNILLGSKQELAGVSANARELTDECLLVASSRPTMIRMAQVRSMSEEAQHPSQNGLLSLMAPVILSREGPASWDTTPFYFIAFHLGARNPAIEILSPISLLYRVPSKYGALPRSEIFPHHFMEPHLDFISRHIEIWSVRAFW